MKFQVGQRAWFKSIGHKVDKKFFCTIVACYEDGRYLVDDGTGRPPRIIHHERLHAQEIPKGEVFA